MDTDVNLKYIDVSVVVGNDIVELYSNDDSKLLNYFKNLIDHSNKLLKQLNLKISTTNLIKWDDGNYINITLNSDETLTRFKKFCDLNYDYIFSSDHYSLFSMKPYYGGVIGKAYVGFMCDRQNSVSMIAYRDEYENAAETFVHELGHSLGIPHDPEKISEKDCSNTVSLCIMNTFYIKSSNEKSFSKSSVEIYKMHMHKPLFKCIHEMKKCVSGVWSMNQINLQNKLNLDVFQESEHEKKFRIQSRLDEYKKDLQEKYFLHKNYIRKNEMAALNKRISQKNDEKDKILKDEKEQTEHYYEAKKRYEECANKVKLYYKELVDNEERYKREDVDFLTELDKIDKIPEDKKINNIPTNAIPATTIKIDYSKTTTKKLTEKTIKTILKEDVKTKVKKWRLNPFLSNNEMKQFIKFVLGALICLILLIMFYLLLCCRKNLYNKIRQ